MGGVGIEKPKNLRTFAVSRCLERRSAIISSSRFARLVIFKFEAMLAKGTAAVRNRARIAFLIRD
jgi:hypothetical protein